MLAGFFVGAAIVVGASEARAYNGSEHIRFPDQAYQVLNIMRRGSFYADQAQRVNPAGSYAPLTTRPASIPASSDADWQSFVAQALTAPGKLDNVLTGLFNPGRPTQDCGGVFANLPAGAQLAQCRAGELGFAPRRGFATNPAECYLREGYQFGGAGNDSSKVTPFYEGLPTNYTGALLGFWAEQPDDESSDVTVFIRPTNIAFIGDIKSLAEDAVEVGLAVMIAPVACLADLIFGGGDCIQEAEDASHEFDPIARLDDYLLAIEEELGPVLDPAGNFMLLGMSNPASLFHFVVPIRNGNFNKVPGIDIAEERFNTQQDSADQAITVYFDLLGITVNPGDSTGPSRYGAFADGSLPRNDSDWASSSAAHVEFEPVDNLARYGWQQYLQTGTARGLGWVLHAIGDALCPHHTIGTLGWGHQPWERFADVRWVTVFHEDDVSRQLPDMSTELAYAFQYWTFANQQPSSDWVGRLIEKIGVDTLNEPFSTQNRLFKGSISIDWLTSSGDSDAENDYDSEQESLHELMMRAVGASIAFLVKASGAAPAPGSSPCACQSGQARSGEDSNGGLIPSGGACVTCGTGVFQQEPAWVDGRCVVACPSDKPTLQGGICTATQVCPATTPFVKNGACVSACCPFDPTCPSGLPVRENGSCIALSQCSTPVVVNGIQCATACPSGQTADPATSYCGVPRTSGPVQCSNTAADSSGTCCAPSGGLCTQDSDCCSGGCGSTDGTCKSIHGDPCVTGNDCVSGVCSQNVCVGVPGDPCQTSAQCTTSCNAGKCCQLTGSPCASDSDCCGGINVCGTDHTCHSNAPG